MDFEGLPCPIEEASLKDQFEASVPEEDREHWKNYCQEALEIEGPDYWNQFNSIQEIKIDFNIYRDNFAV
jgi:hypothetical protein